MRLRRLDSIWKQRVKPVGKAVKSLSEKTNGLSMTGIPKENPRLSRRNRPSR